MPTELAGFVLDLCQVLGGVVEPPAYGVTDVLLPDEVAARLGVEPFQRFAFDEAAAAAPGVAHLRYGHALVERLAELAREAPACARLYINDVRLSKTGLAELARTALSFPNATLSPEPGAIEARALFHYVRFHFKAALVSDEKREQLLSIVLNAQTGAVAPDFTTAESYRLAAAPAFGKLPVAPLQWRPAGDPLGAEVLEQLLERAVQAARDALQPAAEPLQARAERLLALDRARLDAYYGDLVRDLERRLVRAEKAGDETRGAGLAGKLQSARADHAAKLDDAEAKYRLRAELELVNLAVITQPKLTLAMRVANREASVVRPVVWDPLRAVLEPLPCEVCLRPSARLYLCVHGHLACGDCLAPQCVDCKRVYCRACAGELDACVVCGRPVCRRSLTRCRECGQGTCREHAGQCHAPVARPAAQAPPPAQPAAPAPGPKRAAAAGARPAAQARPAAPRPKKPAPAAKAPARAPLKDPGFRLQIEIEPDRPHVTAFVISKGGRGMAQRVWDLSARGIEVSCSCEKEMLCPRYGLVIRPGPAAEIEGQLESEVGLLCVEYHIPRRRVTYMTIQYGDFVQLPRLWLRGAWKDEAALEQARAGFARLAGG